MKTVTSTKIVANTDSLVFGYWDDGLEEFIPISGMNREEKLVAAEKLQCSCLLLEALVTFACSIRDVVGDDLKDIWKKVEES